LERELIGRSPLTKRMSALDCSAIQEEGDKEEEIEEEEEETEEEEEETEEEKGEKEVEEE